MVCRVKICGLAHPDDVAAVAALRPDAMGFVFWPRSPRAVRPEQVADWVALIPPGILKVGVFVDESPEAILRAMTIAGLDVAQVHGRERREDFEGFPRPLWRSVSLHSPSSERWLAWSVDAFLVDTYSAQAPGGTGCVGDWAAAREFVAIAGRPVWLAGGLTPENVREAIQVVMPWGVDVSSGVERSPGRKDLEKVARFIAACREG